MDVRVGKAAAVWQKVAPLGRGGKGKGGDGRGGKGRKGKGRKGKGRKGKGRKGKERGGEEMGGTRSNEVKGVKIRWGQLISVTMMATEVVALLRLVKLLP